MCLDCYPDRCFTYACKNASHHTAVSVPAWCCPEKRDSTSYGALCPLYTEILCFNLEAQGYFPYCLPLFPHSVTNHPKPFFLEEDYSKIVVLLNPIPHLIPPLLHLTVMGMTTHLFYLDPTLVEFLYHLSSSCYLFFILPIPLLLHYNPWALSQEGCVRYCTLRWHWKLHSLDLY